jgi:hypothetical protein
VAKMGWNYRVVRRKVSYDHDGKEMYEYTYNIHEAYVDENDKVGSITVDPIEVFGSTIDELQEVYAMINDAFTKPILDFDQIPEPGYKSKKSKSKPTKTFKYTPPPYTTGDVNKILKEMEDARVKSEAIYAKKIKKNKK